MGKNIFQRIWGTESAEEREKKKQENQKLEGNYANAEESEPASDEEKKEQQDREWENIHEQVKYVCQGGKVQCKYHASPAVLIATSTEVMLQDKPYVTEADTDGKVNFLFTSLCTHSSHGSKKPPCKSVINLGKWKNVSTTYVDNYKPILVQSTIPCMISGEDLKVIDSGQKSELVEIEPKVKGEPKVTDVYWKEEGSQDKMYIEYPDYEVTLYIETKDYNPKETVEIRFTSDEGRLFTGNRNELIVKGEVGADGIAIIKNFQIKYEENREV